MSIEQHSYQLTSILKGGGGGGRGKKEEEKKTRKERLSINRKRAHEE